MSMNSLYFTAYNEIFNQNKKIINKNNDLKKHCHDLNEKINHLDNDIQQAQRRNNQLRQAQESY